MLAAGCATVGTVRPAFSPLPRAYVDTLNVDPTALVDVLRRRVEAEGLRVRRASVRDGYVESRWGNPPGARSRADAVRLRFWIDPVGPLGYVLTAEAAFRPLTDPSAPPRETERMVPPDHPGDIVLVRILTAVDAHFGR